jgi:hypothetical protein
MEIVKEILSDKVDYLNALRNAPQLPAAPPPIIEVFESVVHAPIIPEIPPPPPVSAVPKPKKGFIIWHLLGGVAVVGVAAYLINKHIDKKKKEKEQQQFNGRR